MNTWISMLLGSALLFIAAPRSAAESVDHFNPKWEGTAWQPNKVTAPQLSYQQAFFPLTSQGPARVQLPEGAFVFRFSLLATNLDNATLMVLWGKVTGTNDTPLATLLLRNGRLVWSCPVNNRGDSLFDARDTVEMESSPLTPNMWCSFDVLINPLAFQQTLGWNQLQTNPSDPARSGKGKIHMARQLTVAPWHINQVELKALKHVWLGRLELLPADTTPLLETPNIVRVK